MFNKQPKLPTFADLSDERHFPGKKALIEDILDKEIIVLDCRIEPSKRRENSECLFLSFKLNGEMRVLFTGGAVLIKQCRDLKEKMPFRAKIVKIKKYFTFE